MFDVEYLIETYIAITQFFFFSFISCKKNNELKDFIDIAELD